MNTVFTCGPSGCQAVEIDDDVMREVSRQREEWCTLIRLRTGKFPEMAAQEAFVDSCYQRLTNSRGPAGPERVLGMIELIGTIATILAITGVVLNNRRLRVCFLLWLCSNSLTLAIHAQTGIWSLVARDAIFLILAVEGWVRWGRRDKERT